MITVKKSTCLIIDDSDGKGEIRDLKDLIALAESAVQNLEKGKPFLGFDPNAWRGKLANVKKILDA